MTPSKPQQSDNRPLLLGLSGLAVAIWAAVRALWKPGLESVMHWASYLPIRCPLKFFTGLECPFCGLGRSLLSFASGNWKGAWDVHPLGPIFSIFGLSSLFVYLLNPKFFHACLSRLSELSSEISPRLRKRSLLILAMILLAQTLSLNSHYLSMISPW